MKIKKIRIQNFRAIKDLEFEASNNINVLFGENGSGKSSVLEALNILLSWFMARMTIRTGRGRVIAQQDIHLQTGFSSLKIQLDNGISWSLFRPESRNRKNAEGKTELNDLTEETDRLVEAYKLDPDQASLPIIAYYKVDRAVNEVPLELKKKEDFDPFSVYSAINSYGINFRSFFQWYREREDIENDRFRRDGSNFKPEKELEAVRTVVGQLLPQFNDLQVQRRPRRFMLKKSGIKFDIKQLSDGEKCYFALIGDIARRLATANPGLEHPLEGEGIILIDEVDLHLHPSWQLELVPKLRTSFPNCQFFLTTHSPLILSDIRNLDGDMVLRLHEGQLKESGTSPFGKDTENILIECFQMPSTRNKETQGYLDKAWNLLGRRKFDGPEFEEVYQWLEKHLGGADADFARIKLKTLTLKKMAENEKSS